MNATEQINRYYVVDTLEPERDLPNGDVQFPNGNGTGPLLSEDAVLDAIRAVLERPAISSGGGRVRLAPSVIGALRERTRGCRVEGNALSVPDPRYGDDDHMVWLTLTWIDKS